MIATPSNTDVELRVLRLVLSYPNLLDEVPELETEDFFDLACKLVWIAVISTWDTHHPSSMPEMLLACAEYLDAQPGALPMNSYGLIAAELRGDSRIHKKLRVAPDGVLLSEATSIPDHEAKRRLKADARTLRFSRRAREQQREILHPTLYSTTTR